MLVNNLNTADTGAVTIGGIVNAGGGISVDNTGAMRTAALASSGSNDVDGLIGALGITTSGLVSAATGNISLATHSPLTIGAAGMTANGNINLSAGDGTAAGDILSINGDITTLHGALTFTAIQTVYKPGVTLSDPFPRIPVPILAAGNSNTSGSVVPVTNSLISDINNSQSINAGAVSATSGATLMTADNQSMTAGGDPDTFGGGGDGKGDGKSSKSAAGNLSCN